LNGSPKTVNRPYAKNRVRGHSGSSKRVPVENYFAEGDTLRIFVKSLHRRKLEFLDYRLVDRGSSIGEIVPQCDRRTDDRTMPYYRA